MHLVFQCLVVNIENIFQSQSCLFRLYGVGSLFAVIVVIVIVY